MRLIDADILDKALTSLRFTADGKLAHWGDRKDWCLHGSEIETLIANAPTVDAVEVVRCKDCRWGREVCGNIECSVDYNLPEYHGYKWFCPNGEREET